MIVHHNAYISARALEKQINEDNDNTDVKRCLCHKKYKDYLVSYQNALINMLSRLIAYP